ncbi:polysaccharide pyruvyl transferase family protein [Erwinia sp. INIA-01]|uniref:polysaccharide pyruvyl transferase family protein n=1 Tax=Erwinia sp. INIA01 TaxID=2991500 RepID=UPI0022259979|nr:polysaccharide pyruvyl transferase family protein [Erwinia sp. INIA01]MCW1874113.1 polysaccharide pyruvyl transferase family protein [Erwinia sp. INIA01]
MQIYYFKDPVGNFGDDLNSWLWDALLPNYFDTDDTVRLSGIGTIINTSMPPAKKWYVFTSGVGYGYPPVNFGDDSWNVLSVRGPLSAKVLGLDKSKAITDGAALLNTLDEFQPLPESERNGVIFIPHHHALLSGKWELACKHAGVEFVNPQWDSKLVIQKIRHAKLVIADAMHAAIIADAMRVPWVPVITSPQINTFKWLDWTQTVNLSYEPKILGSSSFREAYRSRTLSLYGENYFIKSLSIDDAVSDFYRKRNLKSNSWWRTYKTTTEKLVFSAPNKLLSNDLVERLFDEKYQVAIIKALVELKSSNGFLSKDVDFYRNIERLLECKESLLKLK